MLETPSISSAKEPSGTPKFGSDGKQLFDEQKRTVEPKIKESNETPRNTVTDNSESSVTTFIFGAVVVAGVAFAAYKMFNKR